MPDLNEICCAGYRSSRSCSPHPSVHCPSLPPPMWIVRWPFIKASVGICMPIIYSFIIYCKPTGPSLANTWECLWIERHCPIQTNLLNPYNNLKRTPWFFPWYRQESWRQMDFHLLHNNWPQRAARLFIHSLRKYLARVCCFLCRSCPQKFRGPQTQGHRDNQVMGPTFSPWPSEPSMIWCLLHSSWVLQHLSQARSSWRHAAC